MRITNFGYKCRTLPHQMTFSRVAKPEFETLFEYLEPYWFKRLLGFAYFYKSTIKVKSYALAWVTDVLFQEFFYQVWYHFSILRIDVTIDEQELVTNVYKLTLVLQEDLIVILSDQKLQVHVTYSMPNTSYDWIL